MAVLPCLAVTSQAREFIAILGAKGLSLPFPARNGFLAAGSEAHNYSDHAEAHATAIRF